MAAASGVFSTGLVIGVVLTSRRAINVTQTNSVSQTNTTSGDTGHTKQGPTAPIIFPIAAVIIIGAVAVAAMTTSATSGAQVSAISQQALQTQSEIVRAMPTQAPTVVVDRPVASLDKPVSFSEVAVLVTAVVNVIVWAVAGREYIKTRRAKSKRRVSKQQPSGIAVPLFNQSTHEVKR